VEEKSILEEKVKQRTQHLEDEIYEKENLANKLEKLAKYDQLTGLANRYMFLNELELVYKEAQLLEKQFVLLFIDLDGFKLVNDTYGHKVGDALLQTISLRLQSIIRHGDLISRIGGDEFTVILKDISDTDRVKKITQEIIDSIKKTININKLEVYVGSSIGVYVYDGYDQFENIVPKADIAMYEAKKAGKGTHVFFDDSMQKEISQITNLKTKIKDALKNREFVNYFQPIILSTDEKIKSSEVLMRWIDGGEIISPNVFIPILEDDISLIQSVTFWQIEEVIKVMQCNDIHYSINISAKLLTNNHLISQLKCFLNKYQFETDRISFEVTETTLSSNLAQASKILLELKELGFNLSLDDFGTGYSSLSYLSRLPIDTIKINKSFVDDISQGKNILVDTIISMARSLKMNVVAEGVESESQKEYLHKQGCSLYQGFLFSEAVPEREYFKMLQK
jgi:diguanylate cyclase (GGDEF)-like protein